MNHRTVGGDDPRVPRTYEEAVVRKTTHYYPHESVEKCHRHGPDCIVGAWPEETGGGAIFGSQSYRYTKTRIWFCCANEDAMTAYNNAVRNGEPTHPSESFKMGLDYYWRMERQKNCGHPGKMTIDGKCYECKHGAKVLTPRQIALAAGEKWYMPAANDPCPNGHIAPRRVNNSSCKQCEQDRRPVKQEIYDLYPEMIIDRRMAISSGFKFYRTGEPCSHGHRGWRYTSTTGCIDCLKGR